MSSQLPESARRVQEALDRSGLAFRVVEMSASTRTSKEAAAAIGCTVAQIAKSILFRGAVSGNPILVIASGVNRVNEQAVAALAGEPLHKASPDFVRQATGYAPPVSSGRRRGSRLNTVNPVPAAAQTSSNWSRSWSIQVATGAAFRSLPAAPSAA
jgi:hypothetical protein